MSVKLLKRCLALTSVLSVPLFFSGLRAEATLSGGRFLTPNEAQQVFGSSIPFSYFDGSDYVDGEFLYSGTVSYNSVSGDTPDSWSDYTGATYLEYVSTAQGLNTNVNYVTVKISPTYSLFNTDQITSLIALSSSSSVSTTYQSPSWDWVIGGDRYHYENRLDNGNGSYSMISFAQRANSPSTFVPMNFSSQSLTSGYSLEAQFCGNTVMTSTSAGSNRYKIYLRIMCPYVSSDSEASNGVFTTTSSANVNVNVDMSETNGILGTISQTLSGIGQSILNGITSIFVPDPNYIQTKVDAIYDKFAWWRSIVTTWNSFYDSFSALDFDSPPQYTIDYSETTSAYGYSYGASARVLVLDWFIEYRDTVRIFLRGFIWLFFIWRVYCHIPNIIQGTGMDVQRSDDGSVSVAPRGKH